jgi:ADP-ribosylglycohydrolase
MKKIRDQFIGCLLGGAIGDALGYPIEFLKSNEIYDKYGKNGDEASISKCIFYSYERWLYTQGYPISEEYHYLIKERNFTLFEYKELFSQRSPGNSCITSLIQARNNKFGTIENYINKSKGCGGVMRAAPAGLYYINRNREAFNLGCELA